MRQAAETKAHINTLEILARVEPKLSDEPILVRCPTCMDTKQKTWKQTKPGYPGAFVCSCPCPDCMDGRELADGWTHVERLQNAKDAVKLHKNAEERKRHENQLVAAAKQIEAGKVAEEDLPF